MLKRCYRCDALYEQNARPNIIVHEQVKQCVSDSRDLCDACRLELSQWLRKKESAPAKQNAPTYKANTSYHEINADAMHEIARTLPEGYYCIDIMPEAYRASVMLKGKPRIEVQGVRQ